jgi:DNA-binding transcriptional ArsR family regulator
MNVKSAARLAEVFGVLASETRLRLLHALERNGEFSPTALADTVGMKVQAVSNQLQLLAARGIVSSRREGSSVLYRLDDPCITTLLDRGWCLAEDSVSRKE